MRTALSALALAFVLALTGCSDADVNIVDGGPTPDATNLDAQSVEVDAGVTDMCTTLGPPPEGAYHLMGGTPNWTCGFSAAPGNHESYAITGDSWDCPIVVEGDMQVCMVSCPGHMEQRDYNDLVIFRAGTDLPFRFYYGIPGTPATTAEFVCYDRNSVPIPS